MDLKLLLIPAVIIVIGIGVMVTLNKKGNSSQGKAKDIMGEYVRQEIPTLRNTNFDVINILEDAVNAQLIWVVAYNLDGMHLIPSISNPLTKTMKRYEDEIPSFNWKKQIAANLLTGNKTEDVDYMPFSAISEVSINRAKKKIKIDIGQVSKSFRYQNKDCYGANQEETVEKFLTYLESTGRSKS